MLSNELIYIKRREMRGWKKRRPSVTLLKGIINLSDSDFVYVIDFNKKNFVVPGFTQEEFDDIKDLSNQQKNLYYTIKAATLNGMVGIRVKREDLMEMARMKVPALYHEALNILESKQLIRIYRVRYVSSRRKEGRTVIFIDKYRVPVDKNMIEKGNTWTLKGEEDEKV